MSNTANFSVYSVTGRTVGRIVGVAFPESGDGETDLVYLHFRDPDVWQRLCLSEGVAYWDIASDETVADELDEYRDRLVDLIDCASGLEIVLAHEFEPKSDLPAQISIDFSNGQNLSFRHRRATTDGTEVVIASHHLAERATKA